MQDVNPEELKHQVEDLEDQLTASESNAALVAGIPLKYLTTELAKGLLERNQESTQQIEALQHEV
jgi:hypothetical protein